MNWLLLYASADRSVKSGKSKAVAVRRVSIQWKTFPLPVLKGEDLLVSVGGEHTRDLFVAPMTQIARLACDAALCATEKPDALTDSVGCRLVCRDPTSLRGRVDLGGFLHGRFDLDVRPLNLWKNSRSRFFKQPLVVLID